MRAGQGDVRLDAVAEGDEGDLVVSVCGVRGCRVGRTKRSHLGSSPAEREVRAASIVLLLWKCDQNGLVYLRPDL